MNQIYRSADSSAPRPGMAAAESCTKRTSSMREWALDLQWIRDRFGHNLAIASAMFISPKTLEANLARIYRKLDIPSRAALGRYVGQSSA